VAEQCELCFTAHPYWTSLTHFDLIGVKGHIGIEVFNFTCHRGIGRGESIVHWDQLLARGERLWGLGVDDAHLHYDDALGGWIMAKVAARTPAAIYQAVRAGAFYASNGPMIERLEVRDNQVFVRCSPCREVLVIAPFAGAGATTWRREFSGPFTEVTLGVSPDWPCFRVECVDAAGMKAWSNPVWRSPS
jgi:hypothetical protein